MAYTKHTWEYGETFTPSKMNNIEEGIDALNNNLANTYTVLSKGVNSSNSMTITFNGSAYFMIFIYSNNSARCGLFMGRHSSNIIAGSWVVELGANITAQTNGNIMTISSSSSVSARVDIVAIPAYAQNISID